jgi:cytochrome c oxidase subunit II
MFELFFVMATGAGLVWCLVVALSIYATRFKSRPLHPRLTHGLIVGGGAITPAVILAALLVYGLAPLPAILALPAPGGPVIAITAEQWWWRIRYLLPDGRGFDLANEIRLPVNRRLEVQLHSADVIHSFWLPSITGKMDMIPGRLTRIAVEPTRTGVFRGACAEYCGASHARMNFHAVVIEANEFDAWIDRQIADAAPPLDPVTQRGRTEFLRTGCGACHTVRGTLAGGRIGPDLTHVGSRTSIGAGMLPLQIGELQRWVAVTERVKPGVHMPSFTMIPPQDVRAIATYLASLQ